MKKEIAALVGVACFTFPLFYFLEPRGFAEALAAYLACVLWGSIWGTAQRYYDHRKSVLPRDKPVAGQAEQGIDQKDDSDKGEDHL